MQGPVYNMYGFSAPTMLGEPSVSQVGIQTGMGSVVNVGVPTTAFPSSGYGVAGPTPMASWASFAMVTEPMAASFLQPTLAPVSYVGFGFGSPVPLSSSFTSNLNSLGSSLANINAQTETLMNAMSGQDTNPQGQQQGMPGMPGMPGQTGQAGGPGRGSVDQGGPVDQAMLTDLIRKKQSMIELYSNIMKSLNDGLMTPIRNLRG